jgi:hypothetical protein
MLSFTPLTRFWHFFLAKALASITANTRTYLILAKRCINSAVRGHSYTDIAAWGDCGLFDPKDNFRFLPPVPTQAKHKRCYRDYLLD